MTTDKNTLKLHITGTPIAKARHRSGQSGQMYNPQSAEEAARMWEIKQQIPELFTRLEGCAVEVEIIALFPRPKNHYGTGKNAKKLKGFSPKYPHKITKDIDNIYKFYMDCMNAIVYFDDRQVCDLSGKKRYVDNWKQGGVFIEVKELV